MIDTLYRAIKHAAWKREGFSVGGSEFTSEEVKKLKEELLQHMADSVALQLIKEGVTHE